MRRVSIDEVTGSEVIAKDIVNDSGITLIVEGTVLRPEYIEKLRYLNINFIYIKEKYDRTMYLDEMTEMQVKRQCQEQVQKALELYVSYGSSQLDSVVEIAENIIGDVLGQPEVLYNISGIRDQSEFIFAHSLNVCTLSVLVATRMKLPRVKIREIAIGCLLHDIGFSYYYEKYGNKGYGDDPEMLAEYKKHVINGYTLLSKESWLPPTALDIILCHHEKLDGSGYPFGISGRKVKKATRIVTVCDTFDCLVYGHMCKKMKVHDAIDFIVSQADTKYDINVVKTFLGTVAAYPNGVIVTTNRGDKAIVLRQNTKCPTRPVIRLLEDCNKKEYDTWQEIDLIEDLTLFIVDAEI